MTCTQCGAPMRPEDSVDHEGKYCSVDCFDDGTMFKELEDLGLEVVYNDEFNTVTAIYRNPKQALIIRATRHSAGQVTVTRNGKPLNPDWKSSHGVQVIRQAELMLKSKKIA